MVSGRADHRTIAVSMDCTDIPPVSNSTARTRKGRALSAKELDDSVYTLRDHFNVHEAKGWGGDVVEFEKEGMDEIGSVQ